MRYEIVPVGRLQTNCIVIWDEITLEGAVVDPGDDSYEIMAVIEAQKVQVTRILLTHQHYDHIGAVVPLMKRLPNKPRIMMGAKEYNEMKTTSRHPEINRAFELNDPVDGKPFYVGGIRVETISVPGHTNDSVCYYMPEESLLLAGDTLFYHDIGIQNYYDGPPTDLSKYIKERLFVLPEDTVVIPGHDKLTTIGDEIRNNPYVR